MKTESRTSCWNICEARVIQLKITCLEQTLLLHMENPCLEQTLLLHMENPCLENETAPYGIGMKNVEKTITKYDGLLQTECGNGTYCTDIVLKVSIVLTAKDMLE